MPQISLNGERECREAGGGQWLDATVPGGVDTDLWPAASWASMEYDGKWKAQQYAARRQ